MNLSLKLSVIDEQNTSLKIRIKILEEKILKIICHKLKLNSVQEIEILKKARICSVSEIYKYYDNLKITKNDFFVEGAFQSYKFFDKYRTQILSEFKIKKTLKPKLSKKIEEISSCESVCVHIRRGDFLNSHYAKNLALCNYKYYNDAINMIFRRVKNPIFYIFSNTHEDIKWIKNNYVFDVTIKFVDMGNSDYEELELMKVCKHFIISNSSFSWWAQYLSENNEKIVVAPSRWFNGNIDTCDIYMPSWQLINV